MPLSTLSGLRGEGVTRTAAHTRTDNNKANQVASYKRAGTENSFVKNSCNLLRAALEYVKLSLTVGHLQVKYQCQVITCRLS